MHNIDFRIECKNDKFFVENVNKKKILLLTYLLFRFECSMVEL